MHAAGPDDGAERALLGFAACAFAGLALPVLVALAAVGHVDGLDTAVLRWSRAETGDTGVVIALAQGVTALGNDTTLWVVTLLAAGYLLAARATQSVSHLLAIAASGGVLTTAIKAIVDRPRPAVVAHLAGFSSASFPSGHAMNSTFVYGTVALLAARAAPTVAARRYAMAAAIMLSLLIGASRVVLGVHWPSDVLAGWCFGALWAAFGSAVMRRGDKVFLPRTMT